MPTTINLSVGSGETKNLTFNCGGTFVPDDIQFVITGSGGDTNTTLSGVAYCSTGASTTAKVATMPGFALSSGQRIILYLSTTNSKASATLNVNSTGAKTIKIGGANTTTSNFTAGYWVCEYDGTNWNLSRLFADVKQDDTTTSSYRKVILSGNTYSSAETAVSATTGQTYATQYVEVQPSTGKIRSKGFVKTSPTNATGILLADGSDIAQSSFASSGHEHSVSLVSGGTSTVNLAANTAYTLTVGGSSIVFKTPSDNNNNTVTTGKSGVVLGTTGVAVVQQDGTDSGTVALPSAPPSTWLGTSSTTAATGDHTHTTSIATSSATNQLTLGYGTKYSITAGGTSYVFTTPSLGTSATTAAAGNHTHTTSLTSGGTSTISLAANTAYTLTAGGTSVIFKTPADNNNVTTGKSGVVLGTTGVAVVQKDGTDSGTVALPSTIPSTWLGTSSTTAAAGNHTHSNYLTSHQTIKVDGVTGATTSHYGTCSTAAGTAAKAVTVTGTPALEAGLRVIVKFTTTNSAGSPTLNVNSLGAKSIYYRGSAITGSSNNILQANRVYEFVYDGSYWQLVGDINTNSGGTVTSVGLTNATDGGLTVSGSPITSSGSMTVGHTNVLTSAQTTQAVYPIAIDKNGHISSYGTAVTIPTYGIAAGNSTSTSNTNGVTNGNVHLNLTKNEGSGASVVSNVKMEGTSGVTVYTDESGDIVVDGAGCSCGGGSNSGVAYCNTAASNGAKEAILPGFSFDMSTPFKSHSIILYVANTNTYNGTCTLNVNGTGAGSMRIETYDSYGSETWSYVQGGMLTKGYYFCNFNGNSNSEWYIRKIDTSRGIAFCDSSGSTNKKIASFEGFSLRNNTIILITFSNSNTASSNVTLNVDGTGAFPLYVGTDNIAASSTNLPAGEYVATFVTPGGTNLSRWIVIPFKKAFGIGGEIVCTNSASSTANTSVSSGDVYLNYVENGSVVDSIALHGMGGTTITSAVVDGYTPQIRISSTTGGSGGGATYLSDLTDVESSPITGNVLQFNGTIWTGGIAVTNVVAGSGLNVTSGDTTTDGGQIGYLDINETISSTGTIHLTRVNTASSYNGTAKPGFGPTADKTVTSSSNSFYVPYYQVDKFGRVTGSVTRTITINGLGGSGGGSSVSVTAGESMNRGYLAGKITVDNVGTEFIVPPARSVLGGGSQYDYTSQGLVRPRIEYDMTYNGYSEGSSNELSLGTSMNSNLENLLIYTEAPDPSNGKRIALLPIVTVYYENAFNGRMEAAPFLALDFDTADGLGLFNGYYNVLIPKNK